MSCSGQLFFYGLRGQIVVKTDRVSSQPRPCIIITCMGRREHLEQTLPAALRNTDLGVVLVDYSCPDDSGGWAERNFVEAVAHRRLCITRVTGKDSFHKTAALNAGACAAIKAGATHLCFVDADTHLLPGFGAWLRPRLDERSVFISALTVDQRDVAELYGLLGLSTILFQEVGGYDESFEGWGCEDLEMRLRLVLRHHAIVSEIPLAHLAFIQHPFSLRSEQHSTKNWALSNARNLAEVNARVLAWTGKPLSAVGGAVRRLTMQRHPVLYIDGHEVRHFARPDELH